MRSLFVLATILAVISLSAEETRSKQKEKERDKDKEKAPAVARVKEESAEKTADDAVRDRLNETLRRMEQMDKDFKDRGGDEKKAAERSAKSEKPSRSSKSSDAGNDSEARAESKPKKIKERKSDERRVYVDPDTSTTRGDSHGRARVYYNGHAVEEGGWMEIGGVTSSSHSSESSIGGYRNEGSHSSSSIGVRATVIRLDGPED